ncbi:MAG TPA: hypothetical protein ACFYD1_02530 [Candidatus Hypogeohydataceae bacterium YC38]
MPILLEGFYTLRAGKGNGKCTPLYPGKIRKMKSRYSDFCPRVRRGFFLDKFRKMVIKDNNIMGINRESLQNTKSTLGGLSLT